jgi:hypothetical protein
VQVLAEHSFNGMAQAMEMLMNECGKIARIWGLSASCGFVVSSDRLNFRPAKRKTI